MLNSFKQTIARTLQRAALGGLGGVFIFSGVGFLTAGFFLFLLTQTDPITACLILGGVFVGAGLILVGLTQSNPSKRKADETPVNDQTNGSPMAPVVLAFLDGLQQGMAARSTTKSTSPHEIKR